MRNHEAKRHLPEMRRGDRAFFYYCNVGKEIVGVVEAAREPTPTGPAGTTAGSRWR
ncbi:MAG: EVE domain-containing protein [Acetobacteraceae bacterium]